MVASVARHEYFMATAAMAMADMAAASFTHATHCLP
jgi:hypothetical protein